MVELKPCPFCGETPAVKEYYDGFPIFTVECENEDCLIRPFTYQYGQTLPAIEAWNWRAADAQEGG